MLTASQFRGKKEFSATERITDESFLKICDSRIRQLYELWLEKSAQQQGSSKLPKKTDFLPEEMTKLLPYIFMVDLAPGTDDFRYRLIGSNEAIARKNDPTGKLVKDSCVGNPVAALENYSYVFDNKTYLFTISNYLSKRQQEAMDHTLFLPTSSNGVDVDIVLAIGVQKPTKGFDAPHKPVP